MSSLALIDTTQLLPLLHPFNGLFSRTTRVSRQQESKPFWISLQQEMMRWQWHQVDHMQFICTLLHTYNHASTSPLSFYRPDAPPAAQPTASEHWRKHDITTTTTTVLWPFFRDYPSEPVPENFWTLWCRGRLTEADTQTIRLGATPSGLTSAHLHHEGNTILSEHFSNLDYIYQLMSNWRCLTSWLKIFNHHHPYPEVWCFPKQRIKFSWMSFLQ